MNILVTGAKGMVGTALCNNLKNIREGKNKTRPALHIEEIYEYDLDSTPAELDEYCRKADFVFNLAGVNRPENPEDFMKGNFGFASDLLNCLKKHNNKATIMLSSSIQATLAGRFGNSEYGRSKKAGEELFFQYAQETGAKVAVYRFVNLMGHSRPKYNSAVSTFCWAVANDEPFTVNDRSTELELLYIDDLVEGMFDLLEGKEQHCEFDGVETVLQADGRYCCVPVTHKVTLGEIVDLLQEFKAQPSTLMMPKMPDGSFAKKLYSLYLTYLPTDKFKYALKMNVDKKSHGCLRNFSGQAGGPRQHLLAGTGHMLGVSRADADAPGPQPFLPQPRRHGFSQQIVKASCIGQGFKVVRRGGAVAYGLDGHSLI